MVQSKYLAALRSEQRKALEDSLYELQKHQCFICEEPIYRSLQSVQIDYVIPLATRGKDDESNFALAHSPCNESKQDINLLVARSRKRYDKIRDSVYKETRRSPDLTHILTQFGGSKFDVKFMDAGDRIRYTEEEFDGSTIHENQIMVDDISEFRSFFAFLTTFTKNYGTQFISSPHPSNQLG